MGMDRTIRFPDSLLPTWDAIRAHLARVGEDAPLRMIDGLPAFPDEAPEPGWKELRVGTVTGMVTVRAQPAALRCVVWGNADPALARAWDKLCWACAAAGGGAVETPAGLLAADAFARSAGLEPA